MDIIEKIAAASRPAARLSTMFRRGLIMKERASNPA